MKCIVGALLFTALLCSAFSSCVTVNNLSGNDLCEQCVTFSAANGRPCAWCAEPSQPGRCTSVDMVSCNPLYTVMDQGFCRALPSTMAATTRRPVATRPSENDSFLYAYIGLALCCVIMLCVALLSLLCLSKRQPALSVIGSGADSRAMSKVARNDRRRGLLALRRARSASQGTNGASSPTTLSAREHRGSIGARSRGNTLRATANDDDSGALAVQSRVKQWEQIGSSASSGGGTHAGGRRRGSSVSRKAASHKHSSSAAIVDVAPVARVRDSSARASRRSGGGSTRNSTQMSASTAPDAAAAPRSSMGSSLRNSLRNVVSHLKPRRRRRRHHGQEAAAATATAAAVEASAPSNEPVANAVSVPTPNASSQPSGERQATGRCLHCNAALRVDGECSVSCVVAAETPMARATQARPKPRDEHASANFENEPPTKKAPSRPAGPPPRSSRTSGMVAASAVAAQHTHQERKQARPPSIQKATAYQSMPQEATGHYQSLQKISRGGAPTSDTVDSDLAALDAILGDAEEAGADGAQYVPLKMVDADAGQESVAPKQRTDTIAVIMHKINKDKGAGASPPPPTKKAPSIASALPRDRATTAADWSAIDDLLIDDSEFGGANNSGGTYNAPTSMDAAPTHTEAANDADDGGGDAGGDLDWDEIDNMLPDVL